ncbi:ATP-binding cassette domain-containing protein [Gloeocapsopsis dulcis]|uniref:ABC transporter ATP-binding protein n=1 Tax=Gloeocapsopsis dulcis AAB1 = 1H9 TaxID=1433147 RepID=A0A6N8FPB9_9CHRO|nr:ABC transporter ATP-binding protein [Gloeocapsopsis dulcis]MUL35001.1 ABC transporter ATP-binding protein [Gloeocapsopsis dulcis AAB1 = 1H9]WNN89924.1 ABC transporter ATP-binding protein [Gloeocapsopsis dulcis]
MKNRVSIWQLLWRMILYTPRLYLADTILWLFIMGLPAIPGLLVREFFNTLTHDSQLNLSPQTLVALLLATGLARILAIFTGRVTKTQHRFTMSSLLRHNLLAQLLQRPGAQPLSTNHKVDPVSPGEVLSYFREDANQVEDNVVGTNEILGEGVFALIALVILLSVNVWLTLFVFLPLVAIAIVIQRAETRIKRYRRASRQATQNVTGLIGEIFSSVQAIQVAGAEQPVLVRFRQLNQQRQRLMVQDQVFTAILNSILQNLVSLGIGLILLMTALSGSAIEISVGDFALFVYYLSFVTEFISSLGSFLALSKQTKVSFERMGSLVQDDGVVTATSLVAPQPLYLDDLWGQKPQLPLVVQPYRDAQSYLNELKAVNLTYFYPGTNQGIVDINLTLQRGSITVITGRIGAGKTTLLRVLLGLLPKQAGTIYWNGKEVTDPTNFFVPPRSAYTPQVPQLFSGTLQENITLGWQQGNIEQAIALAAFDRDLATMPEGLETVIGNKGMRLSGGQLQRAAAARMFVHQPELLVFDDLSSALDIETEQLVWSRLFAASTAEATQHTPQWQPTCLAVSHRHAVLRRAGRVIVLAEGRVIAEGSFDEIKSYIKEG